MNVQSHYQKAMKTYSVVQNRIKCC